MWGCAVVIDSPGAGEAASWEIRAAWGECDVRDIATVFGIRALDAMLDLPELLAEDGEDWAVTAMKW